jgi:hypothetical protein
LIKNERELAKGVKSSTILAPDFLVYFIIYTNELAVRLYRDLPFVLGYLLPAQLFAEELFR